MILTWSGEPYNLRLSVSPLNQPLLSFCICCPRKGVVSMQTYIKSCFFRLSIVLLKDINVKAEKNIVNKV